MDDDGTASTAGAFTRGLLGLSTAALAGDRVEAERLARGVDRSRHMKLGPGGLADVEWTVQLLQLQHAARVPGLRTTSTLDALEDGGK